MLNSIRRWPGVREAAVAVTGIDRMLIRVIQWHLGQLKQLDPPKPPSEVDQQASQDADIDFAGDAGTVVVGTPPGWASTLQVLLDRAVHDSPADSRAALHAVLIGGLVPDEARILAALSEGARYPLINVVEPGIGGNRRCVLENACSAGRAAGVALPDRTPVYVTRLLGLGLLNTGEEDTGLRDEYEILLTDPTVREAMSSVARGPLSARVMRRTLMISDLGREVWEAAQ